jgi:hypothetical protein
MGWGPLCALSNSVIFSVPTSEIIYIVVKCTKANVILLHHIGISKFEIDTIFLSKL